MKFDFSKDFYRKEPFDGDDTPSWGGSGGGDSPGGGGGFVGGDDPGGSLYWTGDNKDEDKDKYDWQLETKNLPYLKVSSNGYLLTDGKHLLTGTYLCNRVMPIVVEIDDKEHLDCLLIRLSDNRQIKRSYDGKIIIDFELLIGKVDVYARWQSGHHDIRESNSATFTIFGIKQPKRIFAMGKYSKVATIKITEQNEVFVNGVKGALCKP